MALLVLNSARFAWHTPPPGHPEGPGRQDVFHVVAQDWKARGAIVREPEAASHGQIARVHSREFIEVLESVAGTASMLDADTYTSPESRDLAMLAAGAVTGGVDAVLAGEASCAAALVRPPGHHSGRDRSRGFCLVNSVAVAAAHARSLGVERVAIIDFDVHHGNGTQEIFERDPRVLFVSTHQWPHYPGSGAVDEVGSGPGEGFTVNLPLPPGATDADFDCVYREVVVPVTESFAPGLVIVSAGFDAHERDPLAGMRMSEAGFAGLMRHILGVADRCCGGRVVMATEGGYDLPALRASLDACLAVAARAADEPAPVGGDLAADARRGAAVSAQARRALSRYWRGL
jgi:acetoin utilization deacetylase AcuC-like enzyme